MSSQVNELEAVTDTTSDPSDLRVLLPNPDSGGEDISMGFSQLSGAFGDSEGLSKTAKLLDYKPLNARQQAAFEHALPHIRRGSKNISDNLAAPWTSGTPMICDHDWEMDDAKAVEKLLRHQVEAQASGVRPPSLMLRAGERTGTPGQAGDNENMDTMHEAAKLITSCAGYTPTWTGEDGKAMKWSQHNVTLLQGAHLRQTNNELWLRRRESESPSQRSIDAGHRTAGEVSDESFTYHIFTSPVGWCSIPPETRQRCTIVTMTNRFYLTKDGQLAIAANGNFDVKATLDLAEDCEKREIPLVDLHGSLYKFTKQTFNESQGWSKILDAALANPEPYRREIQRAQSTLFRWTAQTEADILGIYEEEYMANYLLPRIRVSLEQEPRMGQGLSEDERAEIVQRLPWADDALKVTHYTQEHTAPTRGMRGLAIVQGTRNPCNNSLSDLVGTLALEPEPSHRHFLPCCLDYEALGRREQVSSVPVVFDKPTNFFGLAGDERALDAELEKALESSLGGSESYGSEAPIEISRIIDKPMAESIKTWLALQKTTALAIENKLRRPGAQSQVRDIDMVEGILSACESGPAITVARSVLDGA